MVCDQIGSFDLAEIRLDLFEHFHAARVTLVASRRLSIFRLGFRILQDEWVIIDAQKSCSASVAATVANPVAVLVCGPTPSAGATTGAWPGAQPFTGWKGSGSTGKGGCGPYYVAQFLREQSRTVIEESR